MIRALLRMVRDRRGAALVEFTLIVPILLSLSLTGFEMGRLLLADQKVSHAAGIVADLVAQSESTPTVGELAVLMGAAREVASPFDLAAEGKVIVSSFTLGGNQQPRLNWRRADNGALAAQSRIADALPAGLADPALPQSTLLTAEVFYRHATTVYTPIDLAGTLYHAALARPRVVPMTNVPQN
ncbi:MAG: pilus assembly protein [Rhodospirillales bacterium]|nr:pilus assembly protein [Rhodospirillales bacterium]